VLDGGALDGAESVVEQVAAPASTAVDPVASVTNDVVESAGTEAVETAVAPAAPVVEVAAPVVEVVAPVVEAAAPVVEAAAPVVEAAAPVVEAAAPVVEAAAPVVEVTAPVIEAAAPVVEAAAPVVEAVAPVVESLAEIAALVEPALAPVTDTLDDVALEPALEAAAPETATPALQISPDAGPTAATPVPVADEASAVVGDMAAPTVTTGADRLVGATPESRHGELRPAGPPPVAAVGEPHAATSTLVGSSVSPRTPSSAAVPGAPVVAAGGASVTAEAAPATLFNLDAGPRTSRGNPGDEPTPQSIALDVSVSPA
jgi:DNA polymerase-3 subunit gamma/tau